LPDTSEHRADAGAAAAMWRGEGLVHIDMQAINTHIAGACDTHKRIQIGAVAINQAARFVRQTANEN